MRLSSYIIINFLTGILSLTLPFLSQQALAAEPMTPKEIAAKLQLRYDQAQSFSANFTQSTTLKLGGGRTRQGKGTVVFQKPGLMRWDYTEPDQQIIICDGTTISIYLAKAKQLMLGNARDYLQSDVTYTFFTGSGDLLRDFEILPPDDGMLQTADGFRIKLVPRQAHPHVDTLVLLVAKESFLVKSLEITDRFGSLTTIYFDQVQLNRMHPKDYFKFTPPPETEIIQQ